MFLFFDTETNGLPRDYNAPASRTENWPRVVQIAWLVCAADGTELRSYSTLIRPDGWEIPADAEAVHGISQAAALRDGRPIGEALAELVDEIIGSRAIVAHNLNFDSRVLAAEVIRAKTAGAPPWPSYCTMLLSTDYCRLPGRYGPKWPKLAELHGRLFGRDFEGAHGALADARACAKCFFELGRLGVIELPKIGGQSDGHDNRKGLETHADAARHESVRSE